MNYVLTAYVWDKALKQVTVEQARKLTHINIAFGLVRDDRVVTDHLTDMEQLSVIRDWNPAIQVLLSVGGWGAGGFSEAASTAAGRKLFAQTAAEAATRYDLDGIDIDWEYPSIGVAGIASSPADRENFTLLLAELRAALDLLPGRRRLLTIAAGADKYFLDGTRMEEAERYLDLVQIMTYDMRGGFQTMTGHHTNLYPSSGDLFRISVDTSVKLFAEAGVPYEKIVIGAAFYARKWTGVPNVNNGLFQMTAAAGGHGAHFDLLEREYINKNGYTRHWDSEACAPWLFNGDSFFTYDDEQSLACKARYLMREGLAGIMYWEHSCDTSGKLLDALYNTLQTDEE